MLTSPLMPCMVSNTGSQPDMTQPPGAEVSLVTGYSIIIPDIVIPGHRPLPWVGEQQGVEVNVDLPDGVIGAVRVVVHDPDLERLVLKLQIVHLESRKYIMIES